MTTNVRIKTLPPAVPGGAPRAVTDKVFLVQQRKVEALGYPRTLEPGDVVALSDEEAQTALRRLPHELEITLDAPTRPLYYPSADEALMTSARFNPTSAGRAEQAKAAMAAELEAAQAPAAQARLAEVQAMEERLAAIERREIELGLRPDPNAPTELDAELESVPATNNAAAPDDLKQAVEEAAAAAGAGDEVAKTEPPAARRRRASAAANG